MATNTWSRHLATLGFAAGALLTARALMRRRRRIDLRGKAVLITGGSRGLGFAAARRFVLEGCHVAICARDHNELQRAQAELVRLAAGVRGTPEVIALSADVTDQRAAERLIEQTITKLGRIDVLVNCAIEISIGPLDAMNAADFEQAFRGTFFAMYHPIQAVLPHLRARRAGRIVNITSVAGKAPIPHSSTYVTGKFATTGFSAASAIELRKHGIRVSTVMPPPLRNGAWMNAAYKGDADQELTWFAGALSFPLASADPERAAKAIIEAARYGDAETMVSPISWLQARFHALFPELSISLAAAADQYLLPATPDGASSALPVKGAQILANTNNPRIQNIARDAQSDALRYLQPLAGLGANKKPN